MLHCNGKCYLAKKIRQAEEKEKRDESQSQKSRFQEALVTERLALANRFAIDLKKQFIEPGFALRDREWAEARRFGGNRDAVRRSAIAFALEEMSAALAPPARD